MEWREYVESIEMHRIDRYRWNAWNQIMDRNKQNEQKWIQCKEIDDKWIEIDRMYASKQNEQKQIECTEVDRMDRSTYK